MAVGPETISDQTLECRRLRVRGFHQLINILSKGRAGVAGTLHLAEQQVVVRIVFVGSVEQVLR